MHSATGSNIVVEEARLQVCRQNNGRTAAPSCHLLVGQWHEVPTAWTNLIAQAHEPVCSFFGTHSLQVENSNLLPASLLIARYWLAVDVRLSDRLPANLDATNTTTHKSSAVQQRAKRRLRLGRFPPKGKEKKAGSRTVVLMCKCAMLDLLRHI